MDNLIQVTEDEPTDRLQITGMFLLSTTVLGIPDPNHGVNHFPVRSLLDYLLRISEITKQSSWNPC